jgi:Zn-dependent protease
VRSDIREKRLVKTGAIDINSRALDNQTGQRWEIGNGTPQSGPPEKRRVRWGLPFVVGIVLLTKFKLILAAVTKLKFLSSSVSMLVSIAAYALIWGWKFAVGFVLLLLVHELGHVIQLRREGVEASAPMFIPFLGAAVFARSLGDDAAAEARVGLAGPVIGTLGAGIPLVLWLVTGEEFFQALAFTGFFLNLFNLLPVLPLDGGRAMTAVSPRIWLAGLVMVAILTVLNPNFILILILILGGMESWRRWRERDTPEGLAFLSISSRTRAQVGFTYLFLVLSLSVLMYWTYLEKPIGG